MWRRWTAHNLQCTQDSLQFSHLRAITTRRRKYKIVFFVKGSQTSISPSSPPSSSKRVYFNRKWLWRLSFLEKYWCHKILVKVKHFKNVIEQKSFSLFNCDCNSRFAPKNYPQNVMRDFKKCHIWILVKIAPTYLKVLRNWARVIRKVEKSNFHNEFQS